MVCLQMNSLNMKSKVQVMEEVAQSVGVEPKAVERVIGPYPYGEAVVALGKEGDFDDHKNRNEVAVTIAQESMEKFEREARKAFEESEVEFRDSKSADVVFEPVDGAVDTETDNTDEETKSVMEW